MGDSRSSSTPERAGLGTMRRESRKVQPFRGPNLYILELPPANVQLERDWRGLPW